MDSELVFVYGTLRLGASNAWRMGGAEHLGVARVRGRLYFIDWYPGLVRDESAGEVVGDVFRVPGRMMAALDAFEGASTEEVEGAEYCRVRCEARLGESVERPWMWEWRGVIVEECRIAGGDWLEVDPEEL